MLITNANILTFGELPVILAGGALFIGPDGRIADIGATSSLREKYPHAERLDARGQWLMPANICAHTHFYGAYARGLAIPGPAPRDFPQILERLWWPLDKALDAEAIRYSALVCAVDAIKHGTTTLFDHHASPNAIEGSLDIIADVIEMSGLRAVLCYEVTDRDGPEKRQQGIAENVRFLEACRQRSRVRAMFGLHASLTLSDSALEACLTAAPPAVGFHVHVAEHEADEQDSLARHQKRVVQRLDAFGVWRPNSIAAHCVHVDASEQEILRARGVWIAHQPRSNMNNAVGAMAFDAFYNDGQKIVLGNDGFSNNMWAEWKSAYLLHKVVNRDPRRANGAHIAQVAMGHNARLTEQFFPNARLGEVSIGATADLILVDYHPYTPITTDNLPWHILFGFEASMITATIAEGRLLMKDRQLLVLDEATIAAEALALAPRVWERYTEAALRTIQHEGKKHV